MLLLAALLLGARTQGFDHGPRDLAEAPAGQDCCCDGDGDEADVGPEAPVVTDADFAPRRLAPAPVGVPRGRPFVSDIFRPPIS